MSHLQKYRRSLPSAGGVLWLALTLASCALNAVPQSVAAGANSPGGSAQQPLARGTFGSSGSAQQNVSASKSRNQVAPVCSPHAPQTLASKPGFTEFGLLAFDLSGAPIENLQQSDLMASVGGGTVPIAMFERASARYSIVILVDTSASMQSRLDLLRQGVEHLINALPAGQQYALFAFSGHPFLLQPFTIDRGVVIDRLALLHASGRTASFDAILQGAMFLSSKGTFPNRAVVVITDGNDNGSAATIEDVARAIRNSGAHFFAIGIGVPASPNNLPSAMGPFSILSSGPSMNPTPLQTLADSAGGKALFVSDDTTSAETDLNNAMDDVANSLSVPYSVGLILPPPLRDHTSVHFLIKDHPDAKIAVCEVPPPSAARTASTN